MVETIQEFLKNSMALHLVRAGGLFLLALALGWLLKRLLGSTVRRFTARTQTQLDETLLEIILPRIKWFSTALGLYLALNEIARTLSANDQVEFELVGYARAAIFVGIVIATSVLLVRVLDAVLKHEMARHAKKSNSRVDEALFLLVNRLVKIFVATFATITVLAQFGIHIDSILVFLGGGSVAIALAAQDTLSNMLAGFLIMIDRPFRVGDRIKLPSGEVGDVFEIGLRTTRILDFDNNLIITPNGDLVKSKVVNYSYPARGIRILVEVSVAYGTNLDKARSILLRLAHKTPEVLRDPEPQVVVSALAESAVTLQLVARTDDFANKGAAENSLRENIHNTFAREGIEIPLPQRVVHLHDPKLQNNRKRTKVRR
jgi:small-conductance mechanosensitive channel